MLTLTITIGFYRCVNAAKTGNRRRELSPGWNALPCYRSPLIYHVFIRYVRKASPRPSFYGNRRLTRTGQPVGQWRDGRTTLDGMVPGSAGRDCMSPGAPLAVQSGSQTSVTRSLPWSPFLSTRVGRITQSTLAAAYAVVTAARPRFTGLHHSGRVFILLSHDDTHYAQL